MNRSVVDWKIDSVAMMIAAAAAAVEIVEIAEAERTARIRCLIISTNLGRAAAAAVVDLWTTEPCVFSQFLYVAAEYAAEFVAAAAVAGANAPDPVRDALAAQPDDAQRAVGSEIQQREDSHVVVE